MPFWQGSGAPKPLIGFDPKVFYAKSLDPDQRCRCNDGAGRSQKRDGAKEPRGCTVDLLVRPLLDSTGWVKAVVPGL